MQRIEDALGRFCRDDVPANLRSEVRLRYELQPSLITLYDR